MADMLIRRLPISKDGVAKVIVVGKERVGDKSTTLAAKARLLEDNGFLFPRRNIILTSDVLAEGLMRAGAPKAWKTREPIQFKPKEEFYRWSDRVIWPIVEGVFEGRPLYVRSDAPGDSLGRGVYESIPFSNGLGYKEEARRKFLFAHALFLVVASYFSDTAKAFRAAAKVAREGMDVFLAQFIGRHSPKQNRLLPFMSALTKSTLSSNEASGGLIRFEYGMGSGAVTGRGITLLDGRGVETFAGRKKKPGIYCGDDGMRAVVLNLGNGQLEFLDDTKWAVINFTLADTYPCKGKEVEKIGYELLEWFAERSKRVERGNGSPVYIEAVSSSFRGELRWFAVQAADFRAIDEIAPNPPDIQFSSNYDFYGHGRVSGNRQFIVFGRRAFETDAGREALKEINASHSGFVLALPQEALTGMSLVQLSGSFFSNSAAVLEYKVLGSKGFAGNVHHDPSSEHVEQLMHDLSVLFIPIEQLNLSNLESAVPEKGAAAFTADFDLACDKQRHIAWGKIENIKTCLQENSL